MHKFLRSIGFSLYQKDRDIDKLLDQMSRRCIRNEAIQLDEETNLCEIRKRGCARNGIAVFGQMDRDGVFHRNYYYPYLRSEDMTSDVSCSIQRHPRSVRTYAGLLDEYKVGISLIFISIIHSSAGRESWTSVPWRLSGQSNRTGGQRQDSSAGFRRRRSGGKTRRLRRKERNTLLEAAKNGDEDAMETLTIEETSTCIPRSPDG